MSVEARSLGGMTISERADAARDGSRLAKEALKVAGMGEAQLVELAVTMTDRPAA